MSVLKRLINQRQVAVSRITEMYTLAMHVKDDTSKTELFTVKYENLEEFYSEFKLQHNEIIGLIEDKDFAVHDKIRMDTDEFYFKIKEIYYKISKDSKNNSSPNLVSPTQQEDKIKLPKLTVPIFDGNMLKWPTFYDLFRSVVHNNSSLANIQKFQYLISFLQGEALNLIKSIPTTDANYSIAFQTLVKRYQNKRILSTSYWNAIINAPVVKSTSSSKDLRTILDIFSENLSALEVLGFPVEHWCFVLFNLLLQKIDHSTRTSFEIKYTDKEIPTYKELKDFLEKQCKALESVQYMPSNSNVNIGNKIGKPSDSGCNSSRHYSHSQRKMFPTTTLISTNTSLSKNAHHSNSNLPKCKLCKNSAHPLSQCPEFISKTPKDRFAYIKQQNACLNCLRFNHLLKDCPSSYNCRVCRYRHHTMIHLPQNADVQRQNPDYTNSSLVTNPASGNSQTSLNQTYTSPQNSQNSLKTISNATPYQGQNTNTSLPNLETCQTLNYCTSLSNCTPRTTVILSTTNVEILDAFGNYQIIRVVLDSASQANFISQKCLNRLGLPRKRYTVPVIGLNHSASAANGICHCTIRPKGELEPIFSLEAFVMPSLCSQMPSVRVNTSEWSHIHNLKLADDQFNIPAPVDMLLGAEIYANILRSGRLRGEPGQPTALETVFGWIILGQTRDGCTSSTPLENYFTSFDYTLDFNIKKFWELESVPTKVHLSPDEIKCEKIYQSTTTRDVSGRFVVSLPFKHENPNFGDTFTMAYRCFMSLEKRLLKDTKLYTLYAEFMRDYLKNGHMSLVSSSEPEPLHTCYLPHHGVMKPERTTTKVRVVFNASAKGSKGLSLNDTLFPGPKLQTDLIPILIRFRLFSVVFIADIKQMYLQILVNSKHRDCQRLLWRFSSDEPLQTYRLNTVTFGVNASPYLAIRTLRELANIYSEKYPRASKTLFESTFMDDICAGSNSLEAALSLQKELVSLLREGGFELRKWASNNVEILSNVPAPDRQISVPFDKNENSNIKVLGLLYNPSMDIFSYNCSPSEKSCTKRNILSEIARIFDPLGFISPVSFLAKHIMQRLWNAGIGWDETPSEAICNLWIQFKSELPVLSQIGLPRYVLSERMQRCQLLGFCDASEHGYACALYFRVEMPNDTVKSSLVIGKSKVAPLKTISLPRLELLGATLLADLLKLVIDTCIDSITFDEILAFSDSQVVLAWLANSPHKWKNFVANRVSHIQETIPYVGWHHVNSAENPVDCASRGLTPNKLVNHPLWFQGPSWIHSPRSEWNLSNSFDVELNKFDILQEQKPLVLTTTLEENILDILVNKFSSLLKIQRIICYILRFLHNCRKNCHKNVEPFSSLELKRSLRTLVKRVQNVHFSYLISQISRNLLLPKHFRKLAVFLDEEGFLRVGGRLRHSELSLDAKHPLLLPRVDRLTDLLIGNVHRENLHAGLNTVQYILRQQFWVLSSRRAIQKVLSNCIRCFKTKPKSYIPYMGDLPSYRVSQLKCFSHVVLDYAGPVNITMGKYRGAKVMKAYICIFVCCAIKAIHIELVSDLTSDAFIAAFRRFISRRGKCTNLYSDCGTNFVGAYNQLRELSKYAAEKLQISWHFNPPGTPHFNGLAEAGVKSVKSHLIRVIGEQTLTFEELLTLLTQIEALLNSRPLCPLSSDPNDMSVLTPGHFLTLEPLVSCPDPDLSNLKLNTLSRWQLIQKLNADFWKRWKSEYLNTLQQRLKWTSPCSTIKLNTLVLIKDENKHPLQWTLGRIVELHSGSDGRTRVVTVQTKTGKFKRPIVKLCPLPGQQ